MRPLTNVPTGPKLSNHKLAKPALVAAMSEYCAYCERHAEAMHLHVEHIKPQVSHKRLSLAWGNFLLACTSCNTYKRHYQKANRQSGILRAQAWPHLDNTFSAYSYDLHGRVQVSPALMGAQNAMAQKTLKMAGLDRTPANAVGYKNLSQAYDITSRRNRAWEKAEAALVAYQQNPTDVQRQFLVNHAEDTGFFSIWMHVFSAYPTVKKSLIDAFKAVSTCFDPNGYPVSPRSPGRL